MNIEERLLNLLSKQAYSYNEICNSLNISKEELYLILKKLEKTYKILRTKNNTYLATSKSEYRFGTVEKRFDGTTFIKTDYGIVKVNPNFSKDVVNGDFVKVHLLDFKGENGLIEEVITKNNKYMTGTVYFKDGIKYILNDDKKYHKLKVRLSDDDKIADDYKVLFKLGKQYGNNNYDAEIIKVIGHKDDPDIEMICKLEKEQIPYIFSQKVMSEVDQMPKGVIEKDKENRADYTKDLIFTIDGNDSKDFDDAVSLKKLENGNYLLGVHIADVSHYINKDSNLYEEALNRGTSIYLIDRVIPMLPHEISNGICSLNEGVDRLTLSVIAEYNENGKLVDYHIEKSVINSKKRMTYEDVNKILNGEEVLGYEKFKESLLLMNKLAQILRKNRFKDGSVNFEKEEPKFIIKDDEIIDITLRNRGQAENLIEEFMIEANKIVATTAYNMYLPFLYRGHRIPDVENIIDLEELLRLLGIDLPYSLEENYNNPLYMQKTLDLCKNSPYYSIVCDRLLHSMKKAEYYPIPIGHYGLAVKEEAGRLYTHFTSPIRRINDLIIHRIIKDYVIGDVYNKNVDYNELISEYEQELPYLATIASKTERRAMDLERYIDRSKMCEYLEKFIGENFVGQVIRIDEKGIIVEVNNLYKIRILANTIPKFVCDDTKICYYSNNEKHCLGENLNIILTSVSKEENIIYAKIDKEKILRR